MKEPEKRTVFAGDDGRAEAQLPDWYAEQQDIDAHISFDEAIRQLPRAAESSVAYRNSHTDEWVETDRFNAIVEPLAPRAGPGREGAKPLFQSSLICTRSSTRLASTEHLRMCS